MKKKIEENMKEVAAVIAHYQAQDPGKPMTITPEAARVILDYYQSSQGGANPQAFLEETKCSTPTIDININLNGNKTKGPKWAMSQTGKYVRIDGTIYDI